MIAIDLILSSALLFDLGLDTPHVGLLFVLGLIFGPYGALGAVLGNVALDLLYGYTPMETTLSAIFSFGISYLAYKLWYSGFKADKVTKPAVNNIYQLLLFLTILFICGCLYSIIHGNLIGLIFINNESAIKLTEFRILSYFLNFTNIGFIFGIIGIWISKKIDLIETPKTSKRPANKLLYQILFILLMVAAIITLISTLFSITGNIIIGELIIIGILLFAYLTKPFEYEIEENDQNTIIEKIMQNFLIITITIAIIGLVISILSNNSMEHLFKGNYIISLTVGLIATDIIIVLFFIPGIIILKNIENRVLKPISSFSEIESFINENEKIETEGLLKIYSKYINEKNEIGTLARSYTDLINYNNHYIENIQEIEGEKERINAELDIARKIQAASLPTEAIDNEDFIVDGYSHPAKEVGGDFFDYHMIDDENLAIIIGDASGKGVPAAIVAMITQVILKQMLKHEKDPSKVLYNLNNLLCENNSETMFLTLWLGIYNKTSKKLTFSNAGHNPPLIKENGEFKYLDIDTGIVLAVMEDFDYVMEEITLTDEIVLYTDGITDANNEDKEMYGEDRLLNFFNGFKSKGDPIEPLLDEIHSFTENAEQFDDMTLVYLRIK